ncbi:hypothetical protein GA0004736_2647 [Curtobacterium sp. 9128]|uniref:hypothetical protein n=1 Tax=Curtobacterium sp. 9128 TaxID=1793722 RepID=UPI0007D72F8A|nr:hypothetical protein [Curtobacterium sp. 9128]SBN63709.1 hypothetical protein GA0004736_2647 [Curtobacterium sp. 9128]
MTTRRSARAISVAALAVPAALVLAACSGGDSGGSPTRTPTTAPSASATAAPIGKRISQTCAELVPDTTFAVYGKQFELDASATPEKGSAAAKIAQQRGRVCVFHEVSDESMTITLAVADLPEKSLTNLKDALYERGGSVPTYRVEGYFALTDDVGRADAFADPYWITTSSTLFTEPGSAQPVVDAVRQALAPAASSTATPAG